MRIKNWTDRQAFRKDRPPSWIRLYFDLLDNFEWHSLPPESAKLLIELWLLAAQHDPQGGGLPSIEKITFLLRRDLTETKRTIKPLCGEWVTVDDTDSKPDGNQTVTKRLPNGSTEKRRDREEIEKSREEREGLFPDDAPDKFSQFWEAYPRCGNKNRKEAARKKWKSRKLDKQFTEIMEGLEKWTRSKKWSDPTYIHNPANWIEAKMWMEEPQENPGISKDSLKARMLAAHNVKGLNS